MWGDGNWHKLGQGRGLGVCVEVLPSGPGAMILITQCQGIAQGHPGHRPLPSVPPFLRLWENLDGGTRKEMPLPLLSALLGGKTLREQAFVTQGCSSATTGRAE